MEYFKDAIVAGVPLLFAVFGLVAWIKDMGVSGKPLTATSMGVGLLLGVLYQYSQVPMVTFSQWFSAVVFGIALGVVASGVYKGLKSATEIRG